MCLRCDDALCYKAPPKPLAQPGKSARGNYRTAQKTEGIFFKTLPMLPRFKEKNGVNQTERYQRISNVLASKTALTCRSLSMCVKVLNNLLFLCNLQSQKSTCYAQSVLNWYRICSQDS